MEGIFLFIGLSKGLVAVIFYCVKILIIRTIYKKHALHIVNCLNI
jgi:hypothetical protein